MADTSVAEPSVPVSNTEETIATTTDVAETTQGDQQVQPTRKTKIVRRKKRPARIQVDQATMKSEPQAQPGTDCKLKTNHS
jgi:hypothetical protein